MSEAENTQQEINLSSESDEKKTEPIEDSFEAIKGESPKSKVPNIFDSQVLETKKNIFANTSRVPEHWQEEKTSNRAKKTEKIRKFIRYFSFGVVTFFIFLYLTFPFGVIKEVLVNKINTEFTKQNLPLRVSLGDISLYRFSGIFLKKVNIINSTEVNTKLTLDTVVARVQFLPLFLGRIVTTLSVEQGKGTIEAEVGFKISELLGNNPQFNVASAQFKIFNLTPIFSHTIAYFKGSKDPGLVLLLPLLAKTTAGGDLSGGVNVENDPQNMKGFINLSLNNGFFHIDDSTLKIPKQTFSEAKIDFKLEGNSVNLGATKFKAEDIGIGLGGKINLADASAGGNVAEVDLDLMMAGEVEKNLGFILPNMLRCKPLNAGILKAKLTGPVSQMACN
jgi:type II secretion system protein N